MDPSLGSVLVGFVVVAAILSPLEWWRPGVPGQPRWRPDTSTDLLYWLFTPLVSGAIARLAVVVAIVLLALCAGTSLDRPAIETWVWAGGIVQRQPVWLQVLQVLLIGDLVGYATHRGFHGRRLWTFHAVHHSSTQVDWLSSVRLHPVNDVVARVAQTVPIVLLGYPPTIVAAYVPLLSFYALRLHANVPWDFGRLRLVIASPAFHRWHHAREVEGRGANFAGLFPFIDALFGTLHLPRDRRPAAFGIGGDPVPAGLWAQLWYPFARARRAGDPLRTPNVP
jgi:sterol desaturase/sphingolipid hydroxylase (fatty acid hydroxylase superfamily)